VQGSPPTILVVDDERQQRVLLPAILDGCTTHVAQSGEEALALASRVQFDVALVDHRMPGLTGVDTLARLRNLQPECVRFLMTAYVDAVVLADAINLSGVYRFVPKPCDPHALRLDVRRALEHRDALREVENTARARAVAALASDVAHDLANYLVPVHAAGWSLRDGAAPRDVAQQIEMASFAIDGLLVELRAVARGRIPEYTLLPGSVVGVVGEAIDLCRSSFGNRTVHVSVDPGTPTVPMANARMVRALTNLVRNAIEATLDSGRVEVVAGAHGDHVCIRVTDDGEGIAAADIEHVFTRGHTHKGTAGLGLSIVRGVVDGHNGTIEVDSELGRGTTFRILLPRHASSP
jgi:signal transduction histidine kinase